MYCESCGTQLPDTGRFCDECGAAVETAPASTLPAPTSSLSPASSLRRTPEPTAAAAMTCPIAAAPLRPAPQQPEYAAPPAPQRGSGRWVSLSSLLLLFLALVLPWVEVGCGPVRVKVEGYRFATGTVEEALLPLTRGLGQKPPEAVASKSHPNPWVVGWLLLVAGAGLGGLLTGRSDTAAGSSVAGALGGLSLIIFFLTLYQEGRKALTQSGGLLQWGWSPGIWLAGLASVLAVVGAGTVERELEQPSLGEAPECPITGCAQKRCVFVLRLAHPGPGGTPVSPAARESARFHYALHPMPFGH